MPRPLRRKLTNLSAPIYRRPSVNLFRIEREGVGKLKVVRNVNEMAQCLADGTLAVTSFHIEGAEAIDADLNALETLYQAGLRSVGIVWSRTNIFASGVPFAFPSSPDTGPGLTEAGKRLVKACNELGILIDLSHLNEKGFWDVEKLSNALFGSDTLRRARVVRLGTQPHRQADGRRSRPPMALSA